MHNLFSVFAIVKLQLLGGIPRICQKILKFWETHFFSNRKRSELGTKTFESFLKIMGRLMHPTMHGHSFEAIDPNPS